MGELFGIVENRAMVRSTWHVGEGTHPQWPN